MSGGNVVQGIGEVRMGGTTATASLSGVWQGFMRGREFHPDGSNLTIGKRANLVSDGLELEHSRYAHDAGNLQGSMGKWWHFPSILQSREVSMDLMTSAEAISGTLARHSARIRHSIEGYYDRTSSIAPARRKFVTPRRRSLPRTLRPVRMP